MTVYTRSTKLISLLNICQWHLRPSQRPSVLLLGARTPTSALNLDFDSYPPLRIPSSQLCRPSLLSQSRLDVSALCFWAKCRQLQNTGVSLTILSPWDRDCVTAYSLCLAQRLDYCKFSDVFQYKFQSNACSEPFTFIASGKTVSIWTSCSLVGYAAFLSSDSSSGAQSQYWPWAFPDYSFEGVTLFWISDLVPKSTLNEWLIAYCACSEYH